MESVIETTIVIFVPYKNYLVTFASGFSSCLFTGAILSLQILL
jgi:hypothetical protein